jgi:N-acetylmuramoyl-L-alanine amidase
MIQKIRQILLAGFSILIALVVVGVESPMAVALSSDQQKAFNENVRYFNTDLCGTNSGTTNAPTIVIDPGHSGKNVNVPDAATGLNDHDYRNPNENEEVFYVALKVKKALQSAGYGVTLTKGDEISTDVSSPTDPKVEGGASIDATFRQRATVADEANANLALSIHDDHTAQWDSFAQIYVQKVGLYRTPAGTTNKVTFNDTAVAAKSQKYGAIFASARTQAEGHNVTVSPISFDGRGLDNGNIPMVELFAQVPWVYNEVGAAPAGKYLSTADLDKYAAGLVEGVKQSVPITASTNNNLSGKDNPMKAMNYLISHGLTKEQAAGIVGNLMVESYDTLNPSATNGDAYGIAQWLGGRHQALIAFAKSKGKPVDDLGVQLDYLWSELTGNEKASLASIKTTSTTDAAAKAFFDDFERANDSSLPKRQSNAAKVLAAYQKEYGSGTVATTSSDATTSCSSDSANAVVNCNDPTLSTLSQTRQNAVCLAQQEYAKWKSGQLKRGTDFHKYSQGRTENWCADFVSWIYNQAGYPLDPSHWNQPAVLSLVQIGKENNRWHYHSSSSYTPKPGDLVIWSETRDPTAHVSMVVAVKGKTMTIIGGNQNATVSGANGTASAVTSYDVTVGGTSGGQVNSGFVTPD